MIVVRALRVLAVLLLLTVVVVVSMPSGHAASTCNTFDVNNVPTSAFRGGDKIVVRGTGFGPNSLVIVNLQQGTRTVDLARVNANDLGAFVLDDATIPATVIAGDAAIRALDARGSATCPVTLAASEEDKSSLRGLFLVWGSLLGAFAAVLALLTYRRWKAERLRDAVDSLAWREQYEARAPAMTRALGALVKLEPKPDAVRPESKLAAPVDEPRPAQVRQPDEGARPSSWVPHAVPEPLASSPIADDGFYEDLRPRAEPDRPGPPRIDEPIFSGRASDGRLTRA